LHLQEKSFVGIEGTNQASSVPHDYPGEGPSHVRGCTRDANQECS